jgi:hypothetical protein
MTKLVLSSTALALVIGVPAVAAAQSAPSGNSSCPPGSWFCAPTPEPEASPTAPSASDDADEVAPAPPPPPRRKYAPPPVVVYQPPPPAMVIRPEMAPPYEYAPRRANSVTPPHEWGLNFHLEGAMLGHGYAGNTNMGGGGLGLRFKPSRYFGIETDLDYVGGHDYQGNDRTETAFSVNGLLFLNPKSHAQLYLLAGFGWSGAHVANDPSVSSTSLDQHYNYFGGQFGGGLEVRLSRVLAFDLDLRGFVRSRTDSLALTQPEFTNAAGQTTNTSGGALATAGMTLYF